MEEENQTLDDDLFNAAFDEEVNGPAEPEPKVEPEVKPEAKPEPESEAKPEPESEVKPEPAAPAPFDTKALIEGITSALKPEPVKEEAAPAHTPEQIAAEEEYRRNWPEQAAREDRLKAELDEVKNLLKSTVDSIKGQLQPVIESAALSAEEKHYNTITTAHKDAFDIAPKVAEWIKTQPKILQPRYNEIFEKGHATEVVELFDLYKGSNPTPQKETDPADEERKEKLKKMESTGTVRTNITAETDPSDFDSAFEAEAKKYK